MPSKHTKIRLNQVRDSAPQFGAFEAGPGGIEVLAVGASHEGDGELIPGWWGD